MGYWDIPDGTNCGQKTWLATKVATALGVVGSAYHLVLFQPKTVLEGVQRAGGATLTMGKLCATKELIEGLLPENCAHVNKPASLGAIFGITTCMAAQIRDKPDDTLNYFIGGCASGLLLGVKSHSYGTGTSACVALGTLAAFTKLAKREGWEFYPSEPKL